MEITRSKREELCAKSIQAFGSKYRWLRLLEKGKIVGPKGNRKQIWLTLADVESIMNETIKLKESIQNGEPEANSQPTE